MKKLFTLLSLFLVINLSSQNFLNGDFETNTATGDLINLSSANFNDMMSNCYSFGTQGNIDILSSAIYGDPQSGDWYLGISGGQTDALTLELSAPLVTGNSYTISFYDRLDANFISDSIKLGLSTVNNDFGDLIYTSNELAGEVWTERSFTFVAPNNGQFISVYMAGILPNWVLIDHFTITLITNTVSLIDEKAIKLVQNPVSDYLKLQADESISNATVSIVSFAGNLVYKEGFESIENLEINISSLPAGFYVVYIQTKDGRSKSLKFSKT